MIALLRLAAHTANLAGSCLWALTHPAATEVR